MTKMESTAYLGISFTHLFTPCIIGCIIWCFLFKTLIGHVLSRTLKNNVHWHKVPAFSLRI